MPICFFGGRGQARGKISRVFAKGLTGFNPGCLMMELALLFPLVVGEGVRSDVPNASSRAFLCVVGNRAQSFFAYVSVCSFG